MKIIYATMIASCLLYTIPIKAIKYRPIKPLYNLIYQSPTRGNIPCANRVIVAAEQAIDRAKTTQKPYDSKEISLAIFYVKIGSRLAKFYRSNLFYQNAQDIIIQERNIKKAKRLLSIGLALEKFKK